MSKTAQTTTQKPKFVNIAIMEPDSLFTVKQISIGFASELVTNEVLACRFTPYNARGDAALLYQNAQEIIQEKYDLVFSIGGTCSEAIKKVTAQHRVDIPIVFADVMDPYRLDLIKTADKPGGNMTGVISLNHNYNTHFSYLLRLQPQIKNALIVYNSLEEGGLIKKEKENLVSRLSSWGIKTQEVAVFHKMEIAGAVKHQIEMSRPDVIFTLRDFSVLAALPDLMKIAYKYSLPVFTSDLAAVNAGSTFGSGFSNSNMGIHGSKQAKMILVDNRHPQSIPLVTQSESYLVRVNSNTIERQGIQLSKETLRWVYENGETVWGL